MDVISVYLFAWLGMVVLAIINGVIREKYYSRFMPELTAHQLSTLIAVILFGWYLFILTLFFPIESAVQAVVIGSLWLIMTMLFEFIFGHFVAGHSWARLLMDYNLRQGRVWLFVLIWLWIAPYVFYRLGG